MELLPSLTGFLYRGIMSNDSILLVRRVRFRAVRRLSVLLMVSEDSVVGGPNLS